MIWGILFYYLIIFVALYLWWLIFFCSYHTESRKSTKGEWNKGDKIKYPLWQHIVFFSLSFLPVVNICLLVVEGFYMVYLTEEKDAEFKSFLFKKI